MAGLWVQERSLYGRNARRTLRSRHGSFHLKTFFGIYYAFTNDKQILKETSYPAILGVADFLSKVTTDTLGLLLANPSASPEQYAKATNRPYPTIGCAFDQQMIYENHQDAIRAANLLGEHNEKYPSL